MIWAAATPPSAFPAVMPMLRPMTENQPNKRHRRKRYAGTHPRRFHERYKELDAAKYPDQVKKIRAQGRTPAGAHVPIMLAEVMAALAPAPGETVLDCTLGHGGHAEALARAIGPQGRAIGIDLDAQEQARTVARLAGLGLTLHAHHTNFAGIGNVLREEGLAGVDCLLADLGVSSMQLDRPERGFGYKMDGPLDMRMDQSRGKPASELIASTDAETLAGWLRDYGDEPHAERIAEAMAKQKPVRTRELANLVLLANHMDPRRFRQSSARDKHPAARVFQALRMVVNREAENLDALLRALPYALNPGGRAAILTFHSGEERRVRAAFEAAATAGQLVSENLEGAKPSREEVYGNPRSRSARLFTAKRPAAE